MATPDNGTESSRTTIKDIARKAGVGTATVDRVLNERGNVSAETAERVLAAARAMKPKRLLPDSHRRLLRIEAFLARPGLPLIERMSREFAKLRQSVRRSVVIQRTHLKTDDPQLMARHIANSTCQGLVLYAQSQPVIEAAINQAADAGKAVVTIISDIPRSQRLGYAGIDHEAAGRTAGFLINRMVAASGTVLVLCHSQAFQSHEARVRGLRLVLDRDGCGRFRTEIVEGHDDRDLSERLLRDALRQHPETVAIYNAGASNRGVAGALEMLPEGARPVFVGHELNQFTRPMLQAGSMTMVIDQNLEQQARRAVDMLMHHFGYLDTAGTFGGDLVAVPFTLFGPEYTPTLYAPN